LKDPYEVLEIHRGATKEEIQNAYRRLVKKYHPDQYRNHPLEKLAEEKLAEINQAYEMLMKNGGQAGSGYYDGGQTRSRTYGGGSGDSIFQQVRVNINKGNLHQAEQLLNQSTVRNAEWYFLKGIIFQRKGWYGEALSHLHTAVQMDPSNPEYQSALNQMNYNNRVYRDRSGGYGSGGMDFCELCQCLICTDCCCECLGGDFITCC
jgi:molecular chaperone DnaJ